MKLELNPSLQVEHRAVGPDEPATAESPVDLRLGDLNGTRRKNGDGTVENTMSRPLLVVRYMESAAFERSHSELQAWRILEGDERRVLMRLRSPAARRDYLAGHALARAVLAEVAGCHPRALRFARSPRGRPEVVDPPCARRLRFSLSGADGMVLCAVAVGRAVGADVESLRDIGEDPLALADAAEFAEELEGFDAPPSSPKAERFLIVWTQREAVARATGQGVRLPLSYEPVDVQPGWLLATQRLRDAHIASVAVPRRGLNNPLIRFEEQGVPSDLSSQTLWHECESRLR